MSILEASYIVFLPQPFHANINKRLTKSPKNYFYDVGIAAWLCGIEEEKQIVTHPLRGNLFENMVVMEALKYRYNRGKRNNLHFYRDSNGNEIDILYPEGQNMLPIEIQSGQTITPAYFNGLNKCCSLFPENIPWSSFLIYSGETEQLRKTTKVLRIYSLSQHLDTIDRQ